MEQELFSFYESIPRVPKPPPPINEIKVVALREASRVYGPMDSPVNVVEFWREEIATAAWFDEEKEILIVVALDSKLRMKGFAVVTMGLINQTLVHAREVYRPAVALAAAHIILAHQHPSGDPTPSHEDLKATRDMVNAGRVLGIPLLDHVIVGEPRPETPRGYVSLKEAGLMF